MATKFKFSIVYGMIILWISAYAGAAVKANPQKQLSTRTLRTMARVYMTYGKYDKARDAAEQALSIAQTTEVETNEMALCLIDLATVYSNLDRLSESESMFQAGIKLQQQALFDDHPYVAQTYRMLSDVQRRSGELDKAERSLGTAVSIMLNHCDIQSREMSPFILESAKYFEARGDFEQAQTNYQMALQMFEESYGSRHLMTANVLESMAQCSLGQHELDRADEYISRALTIQRQLFGRANPVMIDSWLTKARICRAKGEDDRCEYYVSQAVASVEKNRNVITLARIYERVNAIRTENMVATAEGIN